MAEKMRSGRNGPNRAELPLFSETGRKPKRPKFNGCLMIQVCNILHFIYIYIYICEVYNTPLLYLLVYFV